MNIDEDNSDLSTIVSEFDRLCFSFGEEDALVPAPDNHEDSTPAVSYIEIQEYSNNLAFQLEWRFQPDYVLVDCQRYACAEAVATLACMRIQCPFVPVSCADLHRPGRLNVVVDHLRKHGKHRSGTNEGEEPAVVAVTVCENDLDPILAVFQQADVHQILYLDECGALREQIQVPSHLPTNYLKLERNDDLMVLFTSGTTGGSPKAVVGSHAATLRRIQWFHRTFESSPRIVRKTALTFVDGITELWSALLDRNSMLVAMSPVSLQGEGLAAILRAEPTQVLLLPSQLGQLSLLPLSSSLQRLIISGEQASRISVENICNRYPELQLINLYGQTETSGDVLCAVLSEMDPTTAYQDDVVAVGKPIGDTTISINNQHEFIIRGPQLSNGYLGQNVPFDAFATGDIGFCRDDIYYVKGRKDDIVKIHGIWTCPLELETAFRRFYHTREALACFMEDEAYILCPDSDVCQRFSREDMYHRGMLPWNLIPKKVICSAIPTSRDSGAGKASRKEAKSIVASLLQSYTSATNGSIDPPSQAKENKPNLLSIVCSDLGLPLAESNMQKSFVELGGNSAKAIALLFILRQVFPTAASLTAIEILTAYSLSELESILKDKDEKAPRKKRRTTVPTRIKLPELIPKPATRHSNNRVSLEFLACVDSKPVCLDGSFLAACQGGVVLKFTPTGIIEAHRHLVGWMVQADLVTTRDALIVCAHKKDTKAGLVVAFSPDLGEERWRIELDLPVKASPLQVDGAELWISMGTTEQTSVCKFSITTGKACGEAIQLPVPSLSKPVEVGQRVVYGCSSWEGGIVVVQKDGDTACHLFEGEIGPVNGRDLVKFSDEEVLVGDGYGALHILNTRAMTIATVHLGSMPLTTPLVRDDGIILVGSNDGKLYAVSGVTKLWECECGASILGRPLSIQSNGSTLVRTTAGHLVSIDHEGGILWRRRQVRGEIWGDAEALWAPNAGTSPLSSLSPKLHVAFGARDARVHIISFCN